MQCVTTAVVEAAAETLFLFCCWIIPPPEISLFLMNGIFCVQALKNFVILLYRCCSNTHQYENMDSPRTLPRNNCYSALFIIAQAVGFVTQIAAVACVVAFLAKACSLSPDPVHTVLIAAAAVGAVVLSATWCDSVQRLATSPNLNTLGGEFRRYARRHSYQPNARWKASESHNIIVVKCCMACTSLSAACKVTSKHVK